MALARQAICWLRAALWGAILFGTIPAGAAAFDENHFEQINGAQLHFRVRGTDKANPYLLILHGGPGFSGHWHYAWGVAWEKTFNVVYLDQRGCGESQRLQIADVDNPKPEEIKGYTISTLVEDIEGVRAFLKADKWYVLGHSWGALLGVEYVAKHGDKVSGFIQMSGLLSLPLFQDAIFDAAEAHYKPELTSTDEKKKKLAKEVIDILPKMRAKTMPDKERLAVAYQIGTLMYAQLYIANPAVGDKIGKAVREAAKKYQVAEPLVGYTSLPDVALIVNDNYPARDARPLLAKITVPTLILHGKQDKVVPVKFVEEIKAAHKNVTLVLLDNCAHFPYAEQPEKTAAALVEFAKNRLNAPPVPSGK